MDESDNINGSNILQFMKKHQIATYQQLLQKSVENIAWYWNAVNEDLGIGITTTLKFLIPLKDFQEQSGS